MAFGSWAQTELVRSLLVLLHLIGFAALFGGCVVQARARFPEVNAAMLHGAFTTLITGALLVGADYLDGSRPDYVQVSVKLAVSLIVVVLIAVNRRFTSIPRGLWATLTILTLANASVAVLW